MNIFSKKKEQFSYNPFEKKVWLYRSTSMIKCNAFDLAETPRPGWRCYRITSEVINNLHSSFKLVFFLNFSNSIYIIYITNHIP